MKSFRLGFGLLAPMAGVCAVVFVIATFLSAGFSPEWDSSPTRGNVRTFFIACAVLTGLVALAFSWYVATFHCRRRRKEIAALAMFGCRFRSIFFRLWGDFSRVVLFAGGIGIAAAYVMNRFFSLILGSLTQRGEALPMVLGLDSLVGTLVAIAAQAVAGAPAIAISIRRADAGSLFHPPRPAPSHAGPIRTVVGASLLIAGYVAAAVPDSHRSLSYALFALLSVVAGTFLSMRGFLCLFARRLRRGARSRDVSTFLAASRLSSRLAQNSATFSAVAIFVAMAITTGGTIFSLTTNQDVQAYRSCPNDLELTSRDHPRLYTAIGLINRALESSSDSLDSELSGPRFRIVRSLLVDLSFPERNHRFSAEAISFSDWNALMTESGRTDEALSSQDEIAGIGYFAGVPGVDSPASVVVSSCKGVSLSGTFRILKEGYALSSANVLRQIMIPDSEWIRLSEAASPNDVSLYAVWNVPDRNNSPFSGIPLKDTLREVRLMGNEPIVRSEFEDEYSRDAGALLFIGVLLVSAFLILALAVLVFHQWGDAESDRADLILLDFLGARTDDSRSSVRIFIFATFLIPAAIGILHSCFALRMFVVFSRFSVTASALMAVTMTIVYFVVAFHTVTVKYLRTIERPR